LLTQAVILVGGLGTRLGALTRETPKPLIEVAGRPFVEHVIQELSRYGCFEEIVLLAGYRADAVRALYDGRRFGKTRIRVHVEPSPLGTAGALAHARDRLASRFLLANGDSFFDFNVLDLVTSPERSLVHMALRADVVGDRFGRVVLEGPRVTRFVEPGFGATGPVNAGVYLVDRGVVPVATGAPVSLERDILPALASSGDLTGRAYAGNFIDIGVPDDFARARETLAGWLRRPAIFFDRDGVLNRDAGYTHRAEDLEWMPGAREAVRAVNDAGWFAFVVTNQSGVARGFYDEADVVAFHARMAADLHAVGAHIDAFEYCPDHPDGTVERYARACRRRKPEPGMIVDLAARWSIDLGRSCLIGDKESDLDAARAAGIAARLFRQGDDDLYELTSRVLGA